jgi:hypothetical protein
MTIDPIPLCWPCCLLNPSEDLADVLQRGRAASRDANGLEALRGSSKFVMDAASPAC